MDEDEDEVKRIAEALKPVRCPRCGEELYGLDYYEKAWNKAGFYIWNGHPEYSSWDTVDVLEVEYRCPNCNEVLFISEDEATKFLSSEADT